MSSYSFPGQNHLHVIMKNTVFFFFKRFQSSSKKHIKHKSVFFQHSFIIRMLRIKAGSFMCMCCVFYDPLYPVKVSKTQTEHTARGTAAVGGHRGKAWEGKCGHVRHVFEFYLFFFVCMCINRVFLHLHQQGVRFLCGLSVCLFVWL